MSNLMRIIKGRKSVRSFDGRKLSEEDMEKLKKYLDKTENPFGIPVRFVFLDAETYGLSSPVLTGERLYLAGLVEKKPFADVAYGYSFEKLVLYAWSRGIGTTWIGGTMKRELFEEAASKKAGEMMPCVTPLGYPAKKRSLKEIMMRKGISADTRMPVDKLFFDGDLSTPLSDSKKEEMADIIEMVRWAPSAVNKQPWRIIRRDGRWHFYEKKDRGYVKEATGDLQKIDVGIALCHFILGAEEKGLPVKVSIADPGIDIEENMEYIASVTMD